MSPTYHGGSPIKGATCPVLQPKGARMRCQLPDGHEGLHEAKDPNASSPTTYRWKIVPVEVEVWLKPHDHEVD